MKRALWILLGLIALGWVGWKLFEPPDPDEILARIEVPPSPVLSAADALTSFRVAPGFRVELVAAEPLVVDPVAMDWDDRGRLFVVEMRGFMPDIDGTGEDRPSGRVVVLEDLDGDGRMDESRVFLDGLVLPRAIVVLPEGVLIGAPPDLILCRDANHDLLCAAEERRRVLDYGSEPGNVEHRENALLPGLDGWLYNAKSARRMRLRPGPERRASARIPAPEADADADADAAPDRRLDGDLEVEVSPSVFRGQWGIAQDDEGRLYYNHNSGFLYADVFPAEYLLRQPATAARIEKAGVNVDLARGEQVYGVRVAPGLNRATEPGALRRDGRQDAPTGVSGLVIQRGHQFGEHYVGDAFVPESAGAVVAHFSIERRGDGTEPFASHRLYPDDDWDEREFLASTDERFRPVDAKVGPDGAIWVIDMYRGVIQHADYVSDYLRGYVAAHDLAPPGATGRIWRLVREDQPIVYTPPALDALDDLLAALDHPNGWARDRAQRRLARSTDPAAVPALRRLAALSPVVSPLARSHALRALAARGALDDETWRAALASDAASVRRLALRLGESIRSADAKALLELAVHSLADPDRSVRLQALHTLGALPADRRPLEVLLERARDGQALERQAVLSSLAGLETAALDRVLADTDEVDPAWRRQLAAGVFMSAQTDPDRAAATVRLLDRVETWVARDEAIALDLLAGIEQGQQLPGAQRVMLVAPHPLFESPAAAPPRPQAIDDALLAIRSGLTWPGDPSPGGARPLEAEEERRRALGAELYSATCATCHGANGRGAAGLAPPLVGSEWVRNADEWLVRIALHGVQGPIHVGGERWNGSMPGHGHDPRFDDEPLAGLLTHLRRAWGHGDEPVAPETIARIRATTRDRRAAWTADELLALPVEHRLDRFVGAYRIPIVGVEMVVAREGNQLEIGRSQGGMAPMTELGDGLFSGQGLRVRFELAGSGPVARARLQFGADSVDVSRVEP